MTKVKQKTSENLLPAKAPQAQKNLLKFLIQNITEDDKGFFTDTMLRTMIDAQWQLTQNRKRGTPAISIQRIEADSSKPAKTVIDIVCDDMAFLIDSVGAKINKNNLLIDILLHPIVGVQYDDKNKLVAIKDKSAKDSMRESHMHIQIKEAMSDAEMETLKKKLYDTITDVIITNRDWRQMLAELKQAADDLSKAKTNVPKKEMEQHRAFLEYLYNNNFTLLGYREYEFAEKEGKLQSRTLKGKSLGLLHNDVQPAFINEHNEGLPHHLQKLRKELPAVHISKTNRTSTVHRRVPMDAIAIKTYDKNGRVKGEKLFLGLFTSVTYSRSVSDVPYLREKVEEVMAMSDFLEGSHNRKALRHILEKYPRDELFQIPAKDLFQICLDILRLQERQRISLFTREDPFGRYISCLVYVPRDRFGTALRERIGEVLEEELKGVCTSFTTTLDDSVFARVMFMITIKGKKPPPYNTDAIEKYLQDIGKTWQERLAEAIADADVSDITSSSIDLTSKYNEAFPIAYTARYSAKQAVFDIRKVEKALSSEKLTLDLYKPEDLKPGHLRLKVYNPQNPLNLSDVMPIIENMGLRAVSELPFEIAPAKQEGCVWIHDFLLTFPQNIDVKIEPIKENFEEAFGKTWYREVENDGLNKLVLLSGMPWSDIVILRTYVRYLKQINYPFGRHYIQNALTAYPEISKTLVAYFYELFDPTKAKAKTGTDWTQKMETLLEGVESLDQDRILRTLTKLIEASLRTNFFQRDKDGSRKPCLSIKFDSKKIPDLPPPAPYREIFVYSPRVEAIHLRGDKIARGGLRWSDRHEDFRTEVLGLMKAQMVKNSVIVPVGAKGGFVVKRKTSSRDEFQKEGIECYKIFIRGLLDITDNLDGQKVIPPKNVVRRDEDDPYLVVAADKGTATFSDIANAISIEYGHWLGDAFASGGSAGYDHKKMGITAKGAWESVKLHFRQLNHNIQEQDFDVVGIGDMGGDVFGNGMLLSKHIRLIGAFNHVHIFCDPDPDTAQSFKERERLFKNVQGWDHYNTEKLSKGGRIFNRSEKTLKLTPEIQKRFDIKENSVTPGQLIRAMLTARTDLLWFGGIGTYIKSSKETHVQVGDKANDSLRVDGHEIRAKVIGEGANLAITQLGRIEYAQNGGKINTDFIDNSGGVDSSDHEVNIKILMTDVMHGHKMDTASRNKLLEKMTNDVADHVLRNNYQQALAVSMAEFRSAEKLSIQSEFIRDLEREEGLNRKLECLPDIETIQERQKAGKGLTRPELCVLLSHAKIKLTKEFLNTDLPDEEDMQVWVKQYFPDALQDKYQKEISRHKLRREIIAMRMAGSIVNRMGPAFVKYQIKKTGKDYKNIAKAYTVVREILDLRPLWDDLEAMDNKILEQVLLHSMRDIAKSASDAVTWFLTRGEKTFTTNNIINNFKPHILQLRKKIDTLLVGNLKDNTLQRYKSLVNDGIPEDVAKTISYMPVMAFAPDIINIALKHKADLMETAQIYFWIGDVFNLDWLRNKAKFMSSEDPREIEAMAGMVHEINMIQTDMTAAILTDKSLTKAKGLSKTDAWVALHQNQVTSFYTMFEDLKNTGHIDLASMILAEQQLRRLCN